MAIRTSAPLIRTVDGERILAEVAETNNLTSTTLAHVKAFLSGVFRFAKRRGVMNSENPMREVLLPKGNAAGDTYAYSLEEIRQMLNVLPEPAATVVAAAAFTGVRRGELRGFLWQNYDGEQIFVSQSYWRSHVDEPKTKKAGRRSRSLRTLQNASICTGNSQEIRLQV